jgi:hypothetical protein
MILPNEDNQAPGGDDDERDDVSDELDKVAAFFAKAAGKLPPSASQEITHPAPLGWREDLQRELLTAVAEIEMIEDPDEDFDPPDPPDLAYVSMQLAKLQHGVETASARETKRRFTAAELMIDMHDQLGRASATDEVATLRILLKHALSALDIRVMSVVGKTFDDEKMELAPTSPAPSKTSRVAKVLADGFTTNSKIVLRRAVVELSGKP